MQETQVWSLVKKLISHMPYCVAKTINKINKIHWSINVKWRLCVCMCVCVCVCVCSVVQLCLTLEKPMDYSLLGSSVHGISQARVLEGIVISFSRGSSWLRDQTCVSCLSCIGTWIFYHWSTWEAHMIHKLCLSKAVKKNYNQRM